jgi:succinate dehydrogenase hydrophobic anchor subunit
VSGSSVPRRFLGRPEHARPGYVPERLDQPAAVPVTRVRSGRLWLIQAIAGGLLVAFLGVHLVAQHFLVPGGLRSYDDVVAYLRQPLALVAEVGLLASVLVHAGLGVRSTLVDVIRDPRTLARVSGLIALVGVGIFAYAMWLTVVIIGAI